MDPAGSVAGVGAGDLVAGDASPESAASVGAVALGGSFVAFTAADGSVGAG